MNMVNMYTYVCTYVDIGNYIDLRSNHQHLRMYVLYILVACMSRCSTQVLEDNQFSFCPASSHLNYCITWICTNLCIYISAKLEIKLKEMTIRCLHQGSDFTLLIRDANTNFPFILLCNMLHANMYEKLYLNRCHNSRVAY